VKSVLFSDHNASVVVRRAKEVKTGDLVIATPLQHLSDRLISQMNAFDFSDADAEEFGVPVEHLASHCAAARRRAQAARGNHR
jgi:hypothetical protein